MDWLTPGAVITLRHLPPGCEPEWECQGYTFSEDGVLWRGVLQNITEGLDGPEYEVVVSDRLPLTYRPSQDTDMHPAPVIPVTGKED